jgi:hypothetical protein
MITMLWHGNNVNVLFFILSMTDLGGVKPRSTGHDITRGKSEEAVERVHYDKMTPNSLLAEIVSLILIPMRDQLIRKGLVVEQSTTPMNGVIEGLAERIRSC